MVFSSGFTPSPQALPYLFGSPPPTPSYAPEQLAATVYREVVFLQPNIISRDCKGFGGPVFEYLRIPTAILAKLADDIGQIIGPDFLALVVERVSVRLHIIEEHIFGLAALREYE